MGIENFEYNEKGELTKEKVDYIKHFLKKKDVLYMNYPKNMNNGLTRLYVVQDYDFEIWKMDTPLSFDSSRGDYEAGGMDEEFHPIKWAYNYLLELDFEYTGKNIIKDTGLEFTEGAAPGNDYIGVSCLNRLSVALLQLKLIELNEPTIVHLIYSNEKTYR